MHQFLYVLTPTLQAISGLLCVLMLVGLVVWPDEGLINGLDDFAGDRLGTPEYVFRLFTSDVTPSAGSVLTDFTEAAFAGYAGVAGTTITWPTPTLAGHVAQVTGSNISFSNASASPQTVYGIFVTNAAGTRLYFAERDPLAPVVIPVNGGYLYIPNQQMRNINP